jgi:hypothetical protein
LEATEEAVVVDGSQEFRISHSVVQHSSFIMNIGIANPEMKMEHEGQGDKLNMTAAVPCEGCVNGYGCLNNELCLPKMYSSYPQMYAQIPYAYPGSTPPNYMPQPGMQPYGYEFGPHQPSQFIAQQYQPVHPQAFHYAQYPSNAYIGSPYYAPGPYMKPPNGARYQGPQRPKSKGNRFNGYHNGSGAAANFPYEESRFGSAGSGTGSDASSLTQTGNFSDDVRRAIAFVKRNSNATLLTIEGNMEMCSNMCIWQCTN